MSDWAPRQQLPLSFLRIRRMVVKELRQLFRDPKTKRVIFVAPVIQLVMFGYAVTTDVHNVATFLVDHDRTPESRHLAEALTSSGYFRLVGSSARPGELTQALDRNTAIMGVEIPTGFARKLKSGEGASIQILLDGTSSNTATVAQGYALRIVQQFGLAYADEAGRSPQGGVDLRVRAWFNPDLQSRIYNVPAVVGVISLLMCLLLTAMAVVREREVGTLDQLLVSPLSASELMLGKTVPVAGIAMAQIALVTAVALVWFRVPLRGSVVELLVAAALFILAGLSLGLLISTLARTQQEAFLVMFLFLLPAIILSGFFYPVAAMPPLFQHLTLLNPLRHFLEVVRAIFLKGAGMRELWLQYLALTGMAIGALWVATVRFRRAIS